MQLIRLLLILLLASCSSSLEDHREQGESVKRSLVKELKQIHTRQELVAAKAKLKHLFNELVDTMIAAQDVKTLHPEMEVSPLTKQSQIYCDQLRAELNRIYINIDGARDIIEKCQEDALHRLDCHAQRKR